MKLLRTLFPLLSIASAAVVLGGCPVPEEELCSEKRCEVWVCGEPKPECPCGDLCVRPDCAENVVFGRDPVDGGCVEFDSPCDVPEAWEYFTALDLCETGHAMCTANSDCEEGQVCDLTSCVLDDVGTCVDRPESCPEGGDAVFDCTGTLHANDCERLRAGARLGGFATVVESECTDVGVWAMNPDSGACGFYASSCYVPEEWPYFYSRSACGGPECSTSSVWAYSATAGECVEYESDCDVPDGEEFFARAEDCRAASNLCGGPTGGCPPGRVCDIRGCDVEIGRCVPQPDECFETVESGGSLVCGCDGTTYVNDCERLYAGVALAFEGACETE